MNIFYLYSQPRKNWEKQVKAGIMPDHVLYGLNHLQQLGHQVSYSDMGFSRFNLLKWPISPLQQWFRHRFNIGFQLDQALALLPQLHQADLIITTNDSCGLPVAFLKFLGLLNTPQIYFHITLKPNQFLSRLLRQPEKVICFSPQAGFRFLPPGVDIKFFKPKKLKSQYDIVAVGRDPGRDYATLFTAVKDLPIRIKLICDPKNVAGLTIPANTTISYSVSYSKVRQAYWQSKIIVVPTKRNSISGQVSLLEALACGKPIVAANNPALNSFSRSGCLFYRPASTTDLRSKIIRLLKKPNQAKLLSRSARKTALKFTSRIMAQQVDQIISETLESANKPR